MGAPKPTKVGGHDESIPQILGWLDQHGDASGEIDRVAPQSTDVAPSTALVSLLDRVQQSLNAWADSVWPAADPLEEMIGDHVWWLIHQRSQRRPWGRDRTELFLVLPTTDGAAWRTKENTFVVSRALVADRLELRRWATHRRNMPGTPLPYLLRAE